MKHRLLLLTLALCSSVVMAQPGGASVRIVGVKAGNNQKDSSFVTIKRPPKGPVRLPYHQNYLIFRFLDTKQPASKTFRYKLSGLDYAWITCTDCSEALYAHLDGGDYTFQVKSAQANAVPATFPFTIEGTVWHRWWFVPMLCLYFFVVLGIGVYFFILHQFRQKLREQRHIHQEKMASLGELTAGIAHEIQNPLNFVNNFSEVSVELVDELDEELARGDTVEAKALAGDLRQNLQKITQHGQRASTIVKGMLEHSRTTTGEREPTDLNALADEYLRLAYQGLRAKDKTFNADLKTDFSPDLGKVEVVPQEIGRVLLNLFNNAFYAVQQKQKTAPTDYQPTVTVSTKQVDSGVEIHVGDNGMGIPEAVKAKIFQPFFTTKPTGEGTGLGLSLSYDIITKGHGGTIEVETKEKKGTEFTIILPVKTL